MNIRTAFPSSAPHDVPVAGGSGALTTRMARVTGPVSYVGRSGEPMTLPLGPCMVERGDGPRADIVWGTSGQDSASIPLQDLASAEASGHLVLLA